MSRPAHKSLGYLTRFPQLYLMESPMHHMPHSCTTTTPLLASYLLLASEMEKADLTPGLEENTQTSISEHSFRESKCKALGTQLGFAGLREGKKILIIPPSRGNKKCRTGASIEKSEKA